MDLNCWTRSIIPAWVSGISASLFTMIQHQTRKDEVMRAGPHRRHIVVRESLCADVLRFTVTCFNADHLDRSKPKILKTLNTITKRV